ncbi:hypothetical protein D5086_030011 [Populus alba]|uniref:Uncharacterized protein n=1 Tax=Populus alba TaxID=43335 RepID=A0ACC4AMG4_POPAL
MACSAMLHVLSLRLSSKRQDQIFFRKQYTHRVPSQKALPSSPLANTKLKALPFAFKEGAVWFKIWGPPSLRSNSNSFLLFSEFTREVLLWKLYFGYGGNVVSWLLSTNSSQFQESGTR